MPHIKSHIKKEMQNPKVVVTKRKLICAGLKFKRRAQGGKQLPDFACLAPRLFALGAR